MGIRILVCWDNKEEIDRALEVRRWVDEALDNHLSHAGTRMVNIPKNTFGIIVPDLKMVYREEEFTKYNADL